MTSRISIFLSCFPLMLMLLTGCGKRKTAPPYDHTRASLLLDTCEAILDQKNQTALDNLRKLQEIYPEDPFAEQAQLAVKRRIQLAEINLLLETADCDGLRAYLNQQRASGEAAADLHELEEIPEALQELTLFRARMPWELSSSLAQELKRLGQYKKVLYASPVFRKFWIDQEKLLRQLQNQEATARADKWLNSLERAILLADNTYAKTWEDFHQDQPNHLFFNIFQNFPEKQGTIPDGSERTAAIAIVYKWSRLSGAQKKQIPARILQRGGLCGLYINTLLSNSLDTYERLLLEARKKGFPVSPGLIRAYLSNYCFSRKQISSWSWQTPVPGVPETLERLRQLKTIQPKTGKSK